MKRIERYIVRNWFWIALGCVLQKKAIELAYFERGYRDVGGEWLVLPVILIGVELIRNVYWSILTVFETEDD